MRRPVTAEEQASAFLSALGAETEFKTAIGHIAALAQQDKTVRAAAEQFRSWLTDRDFGPGQASR